MYKLNLPIRVRKSKNKWFSLNINQYRNTHYHALNSTKRNFNRRVKKDVLNIPVMEKCSLVYTLFPPNKRLCDLANICSVVDKYFCDSLVYYKRLPDDNYNYIADIQFIFGSIDTENPRVEVEIHPLKRDNIMKIILEEADIRKALTEYAVANLPFGNTDSLNIVLDDNMTAEITIDEMATPKETASTPAKKKGRPKKEKPTKTESTKEVTPNPELNEDETGGFEDDKKDVEPVKEETSSDAAEEKATEAPKSLFAGFTKPTNN